MRTSITADKTTALECTLCVSVGGLCSLPFSRDSLPEDRGKIENLKPETFKEKIDYIKDIEKRQGLGSGH